MKGGLCLALIFVVSISGIHTKNTTNYTKVSKSKDNTTTLHIIPNNSTSNVVLNDTTVAINCSSNKSVDIENCNELTTKLNAISLNNNTNLNSQVKNSIINSTNQKVNKNSTKFSPDLKPLKTLIRKNHDVIKNEINKKLNAANKTAALMSRNSTHINNVVMATNGLDKNKFNTSKKSNFLTNDEDLVHILSQNETTNEALILKNFFQNNKIRMAERKFGIPKFNFSDMSSTLIGRNFTVGSIVNNTVKNITGFIDNFNMSNPVGSINSAFLNKTNNQNNTELESKPETKSDNKTSETSSSSSSGISVGSAIKNTFGNISLALKNATLSIKENFVNLLNKSSENENQSGNKSMILNNVTDSNIAVINGTNRDEVLNNIKNGNHTSTTSFVGEISKIETGSDGDVLSGGKKFIEKFNETDDYTKNNESFKLTNLTSIRNCTGCMKEAKNTSMFQINNDSINIKDTNNRDKNSITNRYKKCNIDNMIKYPTEDMRINDDDFDVPAAYINCFIRPNSIKGNKKKLLELYKRRLVSNHVPLHGKNNNATKAENSKVDEEIEKEKNKERQQTNQERAQSNEDRSKELEKLKYKILNGIHDEPAEPPYEPDERSNWNKTIPIDPSMLPEQPLEPVTEENKDALVGVMGIDTRPPIELANTTTNSTTHKLPENRSKNPAFEDKNPFSEKGITVNKLQNLNSKQLPKAINASNVEKKLPLKLPTNTTLVSNNTNKNMSAETTGHMNITDEQIEPMKKSILCFGDSLTKGYYDNGKSFHPYADKLKELLEENDKNTEYEINVEAVSGECVFDGMKKRLPIVLNETFPIDLVIILGGTNDLLTKDCNKKLDLFQEIKILHEMCHKRGIKTVAVTIPEMIISKNGTGQMTKGEFNEAWGTVNQKMRVWAYSNQHPKMVILVDLADEFSRQNLGEDLAEYWDDQIHPSPKGYDKIGEIIYKDIKGNI